jgi:hypothetical protein
LTYQIALAGVAKSAFQSTGVLNNTDDPQFRAIQDLWPVLAFAHDLGIVSTSKAAPVVHAVGYIRDPLVQLLNFPNTSSLRGGYYLTRYNNVSDMVCLSHTLHASDTIVTLPRLPPSSMIIPMLWRARQISTIS